MTKIDLATVSRVANLARLKLDEPEKNLFAQQLSGIFTFIAQLDEVNVKDIAPMTGTHDLPLPQRQDEVTDGNQANAILANAPNRVGDFFSVPKVVE
jgi:aspartyl-tRNA(Asn)/glutamyl-tRNA(Gln) amidotransferase subunit C